MNPSSTSSSSSSSISLLGVKYHPIASNTALPLSNQSNDSINNSNNNYNDDAFGFVFLGGLVLTQDPLFAGTFLLFSAFAAIATRQAVVPANNAVPAAVAGCTLLWTLVVREMVPEEVTNNALLVLTFSHHAIGDGGVQTATRGINVDASSAWIQVGLCTVSMIYGFFLDAKNKRSS
jgi:hypothetical protein